MAVSKYGRKTVVLGCISFLLTFLFILLLEDGSSLKEPTPFGAINETKLLSARKSAPVKLMIHWTGTFGDTNMGSNQNQLDRCDFPRKCIVTNRTHGDITKANAVLFHLRDIDTLSDGRLDYPRYRGLDQIWVVLNLESPIHQYVDMKLLNGVFNWTIWYRHDSTFRAYYGSYDKVNHSLNDRDDSSVEESSQVVNTDYFSSKTKFVAGVISNCGDYADRRQFILELRKYVTVDMFGSCYNNRIEPQKKKWEMMKHYKFYLSFENSLCRDYVTEKYWDAILRGQIPVVNWRQVHESVYVPGSFINIYDFPSVKALANYLIEVSKNATLYNSYFSWKHDYNVPAKSGEGIYCKMCKHLHKMDLPKQTYEDFQGWVDHDICHKPNFIQGIFHSIKKYIFDRFKIWL